MRIIAKTICHSNKYNVDILDNLQFKIGNFDCVLNCNDCEESDEYNLKIYYNKQIIIKVDFDSSLNIYSEDFDVDYNLFDKLCNQAFDFIKSYIVEF